MSLCSLTDKLDIPAPVDKVFLYFTDTEQIIRSFPPSMKLEMIRRTAKHVSQGSALEVHARILFMSTRWKSQVHSFSPRRHITCIWQRNAYTSIEQDFYFETIGGNQTRITQCLLYRMPFGKLGNLINSILVEPYLRRIIQHGRKIHLAAFANGVPKSSPTPSKLDFAK
jgi:ligand-binding SRPBCC domain-containing protein